MRLARTTQHTQRQASKSSSSRNTAANGTRLWTKAEVKALEDAVVCFGKGRPEALQAAVPTRTAQQVAEGAEVLLQVIHAFADRSGDKENEGGQSAPVVPEGIAIPDAMNKV